MRKEIVDIFEKYDKKKGEWENAKYLRYCLLSAKSRGHVGEEFYRLYLQDNNFKFENATNTDYDLQVENKRKEIKTCSAYYEGKTKRRCKFTAFQIRQFQGYDNVVLVLIYPNTIEFWETSSVEILNFINQKRITPIWAGGKKKKKTCNGDFSKCDLFHFSFDEKDKEKLFKYIGVLKDNENFDC